MHIFLKIVFVFFMGSTAGWVLELFFRRIVHGKWVNPGFLIGPYLPIYGFGLVFMTFIYLLFDREASNPIMIILLMGVMMTLLELIGGLALLRNNVRLWDYRDRWMNYKGVICPLFSAIWTAVGAFYYYFLARPVMDTLEWFSQNLAFSFILGIFSGVIVIDLCYSTKIFAKIKKAAKELETTIKYEQLKMDIKEYQEKHKEKYSFIAPFSQSIPLGEYIKRDREKIKRNNEFMKRKIKNRQEKHAEK